MSGLPWANSTTEKSNSRRQMKSSAEHSFRARSGSVVTGGPTKADPDGRVGRLDGFGQALIAFPADGRGEEHQELVVLADLDGLLGGDVVRRRVEQRANPPAGRPDR